MPRWRWNKKTVSISFEIDELVGLAGRLNEWKSWTPWVDREDCRGWKRSPIARENRRESITLANCLQTVMAYLGRHDVLKAMRMAEANTPTGDET